MSRHDADLDRLLRSAGRDAASDAHTEPPFGFATRVVATWRAGAGRNPEGLEMTRFLRRIAATALIVLMVSSAGAYQEFASDSSDTASETNEYAIVDSEIQTELME